MLRSHTGLHVSTHAARRAWVSFNLMRPILVVDDSPTIRRMVKAALAELASSGFVEAASGLEAIERLTLTPVALMVLDLNMPDMHGVEVLKFVRRHPGYQQLPVIVLTTRGDEESRKMSLDAGATLYLTKPFTPAALADQARSLIGAGEPAAEGNLRGDS
jgi:two-component system chemotaxis response regulator CheY